MITVEVADPRSTESLFLIERLSLELTTITGAIVVKVILT